MRKIYREEIHPQGSIFLKWWPKLIYQALICWIRYWYNNIVRGIKWGNSSVDHSKAVWPNHSAFMQICQQFSCHKAWLMSDNRELWKDKSGRACAVIYSWFCWFDVSSLGALWVQVGCVLCFDLFDGRWLIGISDPCSCMDLHGSFRTVWWEGSEVITSIIVHWISFSAFATQPRHITCPMLTHLEDDPLSM